MNAYFRHGLLNHFILCNFGVTAKQIYNAHEMPESLRKADEGFFLGVANKHIIRKGFDRDTMPKLLNAFIMGVHQNPFLAHVGGCFSKLKFRLEKEKPENGAENDRADLLQDYTYTVVKYMSHMFLMTVLDMLRKYKPDDLRGNIDSLCAELTQFFACYTPALKDIPVEQLALIKVYVLPEDDAASVPREFKAIVDKGEDIFPAAWKYY
jgi:hypothetical protein